MKVIYLADSKKYSITLPTIYSEYYEINGQGFGREDSLPIIYVRRY